MSERLTRENLLNDHKHDSEKSLLNDLRKGHLNAFNEIYESYWSSLYSYAYNILEDGQACEDIVQEVFTYLYTKRKTLLISNLKSYLFQATKYQVIAVLRKKKLKEKHIQRFNAVEATNVVEEQLDAEKLDESIKQHLADLPERCRLIFEMSRFEYLSNKEIAEKLDISIQTVKNQITKALTHLRNHLEYSIFLIYLFT